MSIGNTIELSLLDQNGNVHERSGLNWGRSSGNVCYGDAYIPLTVGTIRSDLDFFNPICDDNTIFVEWDDGTEMVLLLEGRQSNLINGRQYAKQISSDSDKSLLGTYLHRRIGVSGRIGLQDLRNYGRTSITATKIGPNLYTFDFSV